MDIADLELFYRQLQLPGYSQRQQTASSPIQPLFLVRFRDHHCHEFEAGST